MCFIITGLTSTSSCNDKGFGGLASARIYLANREHVTTIGKNASTGVITGVTMSGSEQFYAFDCVRETNQLTESLVAEPNIYSKQTLVFKIKNITQARKTVLDRLAAAQTICILEYDDDFYKLAGEGGGGLRTISIEITSGAGPDDEKAATITLEGKFKDFANEITAAAVALAIA